jgi:hypothetical protein
MPGLVENNVMLLLNSNLKQCALDKINNNNLVYSILLICVVVLFLFYRYHKTKPTHTTNISNILTNLYQDKL